MARNGWVVTFFHRQSVGFVFGWFGFLVGLSGIKIFLEEFRLAVFSLLSGDGISHAEGGENS